MNKIKISILISLAVVLVLPVFVSAVSIDELIAKIASLKQQLQELQSQLSQAQQETVVWCHTFSVNLKIGDRDKKTEYRNSNDNTSWTAGGEIYALHIALGNEGFSVGNDKNDSVFGEQTAAAVTGFQEKYKEEILTPVGLQHGTGYVGKSTRAKLNQLYGCSQTPTPTPKPYSCPQYSPPNCENGQKIVSGGTDENGCARPLKCVSQTSCVKEGEGLGAVVPGNTKQCCAGLVAFVPTDIVGTRGTCVKSTSTPSITVLSPNGGENWKVGETHAIKWSSKYSSMTAAPTVTIKLTNTRLTANILPNTALIDKVFDTGSYDWKIPSKLGSMNLGGNTYKVKIERDIGNVGVDVDLSDSVFIIGYLPD